MGIVAKSLGNGFFDAVHKGADEAGKELDAEVIFIGPTTPTAEGQIEVLNSLIAQRVDAIAVSANDPDALVPTLKRAMERGIKVISYDSGVDAAGRIAHLAPSSDQLIGETVVALAAELAPQVAGKGKASSRLFRRRRLPRTRIPGSRKCARHSSRMRVSNSSAWSTATTFPTSRIAKPLRCSSNIRISRCWSASAPSESWPRRVPSKIRA